MDRLAFEPRDYTAIVRDLLTTLTGGTVAEQAVVPVSGPVELTKLASRPFRRVSFLEGRYDAGGEERVIRFTEADFELADRDGDGMLDAIVFRPQGRTPIPGSIVTVNYYPVQLTSPVPLTDLNVGSVVRTLLETVGRELAVTEQYLDRIYDSAFLSTAEGASLDRVVALVGLTRLPAGFPLVTARFSRNAASGGRITVPAGTGLVDDAAHRYTTIATIALEPGEPSRSVLAAGTSRSTALVAAGRLRLETLVAGLSDGTNPEPAFRIAADETDDELRRRAQGALRTEGRGTVDALRYGLTAIPGVRDVRVTEFPNGIPGEVRIDIAYESPDDAILRDVVAERIEQLRPAGIRVTHGEAGRRTVGLRVSLVLAGSGVPPSSEAALTAAVEERVVARLRSVPPGGVVRVTTLTAAVLEDPLIADVTLTFRDGAGTAVDPPQLAAGEVIDVVRPVVFDPLRTESAVASQSISDVDLVLPVVLQAGVTLADATSALTLAVDGHLALITPLSPLTVDGMAAAVRDDTRYALVRQGVTLLVEHGGRFVQLLDGQGEHRPVIGETLRRRTIDIQERDA